MTTMRLLYTRSRATVLALLLGAQSACGSSDKARATTAQPASDGEMAGMAGMDMPGMNHSAANSAMPGTAIIDSAQRAQFGITLGTVARRTLSAELRTTGSVVTAESRVSDVVSKVSGFVEQLPVSTTGTTVARGHVMLELFSPELQTAFQELLVARDLAPASASRVPGVSGNTTDLLAAATQRLRLLDVSDEQIAEVLRSGHVPRTVPIRALTSGVVTIKHVVRGQRIEAGASLFTIADLREVWVEAAIRESDAGALRVGMSASITTPSLTGDTIRGRIALLDPLMDSTSRSLRARIVVANSALKLRPGMSASVVLHVPSRAVLAVPTSAVVRTGTRALVFVDMGGGQLMAHDVTLGQTVGDATEVLGGVSEGQRVVTSAQFLLESEANVGDVMRAMLGQGSAHAMAGAKTDMPSPIVPAPATSTPRRQP